MYTRTHESKFIYKPICEDHVNQIIRLAQNSKAASTDSLKSNIKLNNSIQSLSLSARTTPEIINRVSTLLTRAQILTLDSLTTSTKARKTGLELIEISKKLDALFNQVKEELGLLIEASKKINTDANGCTEMIKESTEFIEITALSAQFISHFASTDNASLDIKK